MPRARKKPPQERLPVSIKESEIVTLAKMLGLLGSEHAGERAVAALKASQWLAGRDLTWRELLLPEPAKPAVKVSVGSPQSTALQLQQKQLEQKLREAEVAKEQADRVLWRAQQQDREATERLHAAKQREAAVQARVDAVNAVERRLAARVAETGERAGVDGDRTKWARASVVVEEETDPLPWLAPLEQFLTDHATYLLRNVREQQFMFDLQTRARTWGAACRLTDKQEAWLRDILARAGLSW